MKGKEQSDYVIYLHDISFSQTFSGIWLNNTNELLAYCYLKIWT
jgi:hypothetical protein